MESDLVFSNYLTLMIKTCYCFGKYTRPFCIIKTLKKCRVQRNYKQIFRMMIIRIILYGWLNRTPRFMMYIYKVKLVGGLCVSTQRSHALLFTKVKCAVETFCGINIVVFGARISREGFALEEVHALCHMEYWRKNSTQCFSRPGIAGTWARASAKIVLTLIKKKKKLPNIAPYV